MKTLFIKKHISVAFLLAIIMVSNVSAQALLKPSSNRGGAYNTIRSARFAVEGPDAGASNCTSRSQGDHSSFGNHITQAYDASLKSNVFVFHSHVGKDSDRCIKFDRVRTEVKGGAGNHNEIIHKKGEKSYYRWQFKLPGDFQGANSFCHVFQNKAQGGSDAGFPIITITARASTVEVLHDAGDRNPRADQGRLANAPISKFKGKWVEVYMYQKHQDNGEIHIKISDIASGATILETRKTNIDLWRDGSGVVNRPKFGIYRSIKSPRPKIKDEKISFASFCASEAGASKCPSMIRKGGGNAGQEGLFFLKNVRSGKYLDSNGKSVVTSSRTGNPDQQWRLQKSSGSYYNIDSEYAGRGVIEATGSSTVMGTNTQPISTQNNREWRIESLGSNKYRFKNVDTNSFLAESNSGSMAEHTGWNGERAQWVLERVPNSNRKAYAGESIRIEEIIKVHPNPASTHFTVTLEQSHEASAKLMRLNGQLIRQYQLSKPINPIERPANLPPGMYLIQVSTNEGAVSNHKIVFE